MESDMTKSLFFDFSFTRYPKKNTPNNFTKKNTQPKILTNDWCSPSFGCYGFVLPLCQWCQTAEGTNASCQPSFAADPANIA
jgi:hypothetical protein